jgi:hypothetical protein
MPIEKQQTKLAIQNVCAFRGIICKSDYHLVKSKIIFTFINKRQIINTKRGSKFAIINIKTLKYLYVPSKIRILPFWVQNI